ncbi:serine/arginine repetitive matrix protein 2-like [Melanotaenia boesemani]|uniref:serine/arginine repetitive matrix protein 2-like n=1 Tax=Melanotaenia boesemani TaxID=1250792 RepID=UPI001C05776E|nr:serine/arginine repetitive matrix protein 2-like [Melanotaenia boesemani]
MNNVLAVGGRAVTLTANTNAPTPYFATTPPSPTAVAINLLNLLKIANTMSHPLYNPYASGKPSSSQGQYGHSSGSTERDPRTASSHLGPRPSFSSSGLSSGPVERDPRMSSPHLGPGSNFNSSGLSSEPMERNPQVASSHIGFGSSFNSSGLSSGPTERNPLMASPHLGPGSSFSSSGLPSGPTERNPRMASPYLGPGSSFNSSGLSSGQTERNPLMASPHLGPGTSFSSSGLSSGPAERNTLMASPHLGPGSGFNSSGLSSGPTERDPRKASPHLGPGSSLSSSGPSSGTTERDPRKASPHLGPGTSFSSSQLSSASIERDPRKASSNLGPGSSFSSSQLSSALTERDPRKASLHLGPGSSFSSSGLSSGPTERDPRKASSHLGPASSLNSSGASSVTLGNTMGTISSLISMPASYRPERSRATDDSIERSVDLHLSRAREEVRHQSASQGSHFTSTQRDKFPSSSTGATSYLTSTATQGHSNVKSGSSSLDWLPICKTANEDNSSKIYSSNSSDYLISGDSRFNASSEENCEMQSIPGLGGYDETVPDKSVPPTESVRPKYTSESASNILLHFGLEKEDLEHLILYPEDQITPDNLPFILRQIRIQKTKSSTAVQSVSYSTTQPTTTMSGMGSTSRGAGIHQDELSSILKPSKVIDYGHTGKYTAEVGDGIGRTVGSKPNSSGGGGALLKDTFSGSSREPLQRSMTEVKSSSFVSSHGQVSPVTSLGSMRSSVAPPASGSVKRLAPQTNQPSKPIFSTFSMPKKDTDMRQLNLEASKSLPLKQSEPDLHSTPKTQSSCTLYRGVHPSRPGLVLIGRNDDSFSKTQSKTQGQTSKVAEQVKQQQTQRQQPEQQLLQRGQALQPRVLTAVKPVPPSSVVPGIVTVPPAPPQPTSRARAGPPQATLPSSSKEIGVSKHIPTPAMLQDYAAATPRTFPHSCVLCNRQCTNMKDWLSHQNTSLHLENCRLLRTRYPEWDGEILSKSNSGKDVKPLPSMSAQTSQNRHQKTRHEGPTRSHSPHHQHGSEDRREKRSSRSRSRSPRQYYASEGRREKRCSRSPPYTTRHPCRSRSRSLSPRYDRPTSSRYQSRSKSHERRFSPRSRDEKRSSPRRSRERRSPLRRNDDKRSPPLRSRERRSSTERPLPQRMKSSSTERLAKRLLETSAVQSLSNPSDLEAMVKSLAPALLAELAKMKSSSTSATSSSSSPGAAKKVLSTKITKAKPSLQKSGTSSSAKPKGKSSPPTMVKLKGVNAALTHKDVLMAMEDFGKTKSVVLFRLMKEAVVCFEKVEDAQTLRNMKTFEIKGMVVTVDREKDTVAKKPVVISTKKPAQQKSAKSSDSTAPTTKPTSTGKAPLTLPSGAKKTTKGKLTTKAKILVSKAKNISTKQTGKAVKADNTAGKGKPKSVEVKKEASKLSGAKIPAKRPDTSDSKQNPKLKKPQSSSKETVGTPKETSKVDKPSNLSVSKSIKGKETVTKSCTSTSKTTPATPKPRKEANSSAGVAAVKTESGKETVAKTKKVSENQPNAAETFKAKILEVKAEESGKMPEDTAKVCQTGKEKHTEMKQQQKSAKEVKDSEQLEPGETVAEPMDTSPSNPSDTSTSTKPQVLSPDTQQASTLKSKGQQKIDEKALPAKPCDPPTSTTHPPQSTQITLKGSSAEAALKAKQTDQGAETKPEQKAEVQTQKDSTPTAVNVSDVSPEVATSASGCVQMETILPSNAPPPEPGDNGQQPISSPSVVSATSAGAILPETGSTKPAVKVNEAPAPETKITAHTTFAPKASEDVKKVKEEGSTTKTLVTSAAEHILPASNPPLLITSPVKSEEKTEFSQLEVETLHKHRLTQGGQTQNKDKESAKKSDACSASVKEEGTPQQNAQDDTEADVSSFDEEMFNFEDFVTVDEIGEDVEDAAADKSSSLHNQTSKEKKEQPSSDVSSTAKKSSTRSSKVSKSSASSSSSLSSLSKAMKSSSNPNLTSASPKRKRDSSESTKSKTKSSSSATVCKTSSSSSSSQLVQTPAPPSQKALPSKTKPHTSSTGRSTRSSAAPGKMSVETPQSRRADTKPTETEVTASDHKVAAESIAAKTVESETKIETSSEMDPPAQRQELELVHQTQNVKTNFKDETVHEEDESKDKEGKKDDKCIEEEGDGEHYQILDSFSDQTDEQMNKEDNQDASSKTQTPGPEQSQTSHEDHQVLDRVEDKSKACPEMQMDYSPPKDQPATAEVDKSEGCAKLHASDGNVTQILDSYDISAVDHGVNKTEAMDKDTNQIPRAEKDEAQEIQTEGEILSEESSKITKDAGQIYGNKKQTLEDTEQESLETLDSVNDQIIAEGESLKLETPSDQISKADVGSTEEDEDAYQVIDSLEDQLTETELEAGNKEQEAKTGNVPSSRVDKPNGRGGLRTKTSKSEEKEKSPKKPDRTVKHETLSGKDKKTDEDSEEAVYEVVDSVEDESVQEILTTKRLGRKRTTRGTKKDKTPTSNSKEAPEKADGEEETVYKILDSVEDEASTDEPTIPTRSTRGGREKLKEAEKEKSGKAETPTRKRNTPARDSQERNKEKTTEKDDKAPKENTQKKKSDAALRDPSEEETTYEVLDAVEEEAVEDVRFATPVKPKRGRPKKDIRTAKKQRAAQKREDSFSKGAEEEEEEATYQILDSLEDETGDDQTPVDQTKSARMLRSPKEGRKKPRANSPINEEEEEEEEPMYQIVDSLEDDQVQEELMTIEMSKKKEEKSKEKDEITTKDRAAGEKEDTKTRDSKTVEGSKPELMEEKILDQLVKDLEEVNDEPSAERSGKGKDRTLKPDIKKEDKPATKSQSGAATSDKKQKSKKKDTMTAGSSLVNLDEVSDEEEDYPDDTAEKEELKKSQAAAEERERAEEERRTRERERRSQSRGSSGGRGRKTKGKGQQNEEKRKKNKEKVEEDTQELVTLDEVGEDEAAEGQGWDREIMEAELQELVTLDEIVEDEEEEEGKEEKTRQKSQPVDFPKPESLISSDEPGQDEDEKKDEEGQEEASRSAKRKCDDDTEDGENFLTLDEVGKTEKEEKEAPANRTRGRPKKRSRLTPVKKSTARTTVSSEEQHPPAVLGSFSTLDKDTSALSSDEQLETQKTEEEAAGRTDVQSTSAGCPDNQTLEGSVEEEKEGSRADVKVTDKRRREFAGPEAKRSRSQSPCVPDVKLPPFSPNNPLGQEFVVPKSGFFCNLCSIFYLNESTAKEVHCCSQKHYDNLLKHYQKLQKKTSKTSTQSSKDAASDGST